ELLAWRTRRYFSKRCGISSAGMPCPVSRKTTATHPSWRAALTVTRPPAAVYLMALPSRLATTRWSWDSSATSAASRSVSSASRTPLRRAVEPVGSPGGGGLSGPAGGRGGGGMRAPPRRGGGREGETQPLVGVAAPPVTG